MSTALGPGSGSQIRKTVLNVSSATIPKGRGVSIDVASTTKYLASSVQEQPLTVVLYASAGVNALIGVAADDIPAGQGGEIIVWGLATLVSAAAVTAGNALEPDTVGKFDDAPGTLPGFAEIGLAIGAPTGADQLFLAFVNFLAWDGSYGAP